MGGAGVNGVFQKYFRTPWRFRRKPHTRAFAGESQTARQQRTCTGVVCVQITRYSRLPPGGEVMWWARVTIKNRLYSDGRGADRRPSGGFGPDRGGGGSGASTGGVVCVYYSRVCVCVCTFDRERYYVHANKDVCTRIHHRPSFSFPRRPGPEEVMDCKRPWH